MEYWNLSHKTDGFLYSASAEAWVFLLHYCNIIFLPYEEYENISKWFNKMMPIWEVVVYVQSLYIMNPLLGQQSGFSNYSPFHLFKNSKDN